MCCHSAGFATKSGRKSPIAAVSGVGVRGHDSKMIIRVCSQARDVRSDVLITIASFGLIRRSVSVADGSSVLKIDRCAALAEFRSIVNDFAQANFSLTRRNAPDKREP
jgi:hypothetical protein